MFWGSNTHEGVGTFTETDGKINSQKSINILEINLWPAIVRHFQNEDYLFQHDNASVNSSKATKLWKTENELKCLTSTSQSPQINIIENVLRPITIRFQRHVENIHNREALI